MKVRYVFSEMPYAMALMASYVKSRCSFCARDASKTNLDRRMCSCQAVMYCSDLCLDNDLSLHENECLAFKMGKSPGRLDSVHVGVRLIGRTVGRYRLDNGVVNLSFDFPSDQNKDRSFDDLMTHAWDLRFSATHETAYQNVKKNFYWFFNGTSLASTPKWLLRKFFNRLCINGFALCVRLSAELDSAAELGETIYLNASRFNHSCRPSCLYRFDGARIVIEYIDHQAIESTPPIKFSGQQLENLTLQYGFLSDCNYGITCPMVDQRRHGLETRYFFKCRCEVCSDKNRNRMQKDAAPIECNTCKSPYVWNQWMILGTMRLKKTCKCGHEKGSKSDEAISMMFRKDDLRDVKTLMKKWKKSMRKAKSFNGVVEYCLPLMHLAEKYWHPVYNLRRGQLTERIWIAQLQLAAKDGLKFPGYPGELDTLLKDGETMLTIYCTYFEPYMLSTIQYAADVADLYKLRGKPEDVERMEHWYKFAIQSWIDRGEIDCAEAIEERRSAPSIF